MKDIANHLAACRQKRGLAAADLAQRAGISRQTIYAIEAGSYVPNTAVALRLARVLEVGVEDLFALASDVAVEPPAEQVMSLPQAERPCAGDPVELCLVDRYNVAAAVSPIPWYLPTADAVLVEAPAASGRAAVNTGAGNGRLSRYRAASRASTVSPETGRSSGSAPKSPSPTSAASKSL